MTETLPRIRYVVVSITAVYWVAMFVATHLPPSRMPKTHISDKSAHFFAYATLAALLLLSLRLLGLGPRVAAWTTVAVCFVYGAIDELLQPLVGRICSFDDWIANAAGTVTVVSLAICWESIRDARGM